VEETLASSLLAGGIPGIAILVLLYAIRKKDNDLTASQENRIKEAKDSLKAVSDACNLMEKTTDLLNKH